MEIYHAYHIDKEAVRQTFDKVTPTRYLTKYTKAMCFQDP